MTLPMTIAGKFAVSTATTISDAPAATAAAPRIVARRGASWPSHTPAIAAAAGSTTVVAPPTSPLSMPNAADEAGNQPHEQTEE